ncbi:MAG: TIGR01459 family HAD-type hydrolase [Methyloceanibacter sp.]|uniref:TIGR01459 family HAD-type hydrolase n=1 Tax=Methyloceanibacter sp. TaxID=1965321 RepID=UPI003D6CA679
MTVSAPAIPVVESLKEIGSRYRAWLVDIWGVMHNGHSAFPRATAATRAFREAGGIVVLLSNSPRPSPAVQQQLRHFGVPDDAYDITVTSGDLTRHELGKHKGARVFHLGPERDRPIFTGLDVTLADWPDAELIVCSGPFDDDNETPDDYVELLQELAARRLPMICANPDHLVERGHRLVYCAGALAAVYERMGGSVLYAGKPHPPVYELALETISRLAGREIGKHEVLAIGDGVNTDIAGAEGFGIDAVFVASALHAPGEGGTALDALHIAELFAGASKRPLAATHALVW